MNSAQTAHFRISTSSNGGSSVGDVRGVRGDYRGDYFRSSCLILNLSVVLKPEINF